MPRFVLLYHDCPSDYERASHWDLMLEAGETLRTWALERLPSDWRAIRSRTAVAYPDCPSIAGGNVVTAMSLGDHRRDYLELEGPLSGGRGKVMRVAAGAYSRTFEPGDEWRVTLGGADLMGNLAIRPSSPDGLRWMLECLPAG